MHAKRGFTLVELLVVVAIIIALIAILLPSMSRAVDLAQRAVCLSNQHQMMNGGIAMAADNRGSFIPVSTFGWEYQMMMPDKTPGYDVSAFERAVPDPDAFYCPSREGAGWGSDPERLWRWQTEMAPTNLNYHIKHLVDYWLYFLSGHATNGVLYDGPYRLSTAASDATTITCWSEGRGISGTYAGNTYRSIHGPEGLPSAFLDGHTEWVDRADLVYDGRIGVGVEILRAARSRIIGQPADGHPQSASMDP